MANRWLCHTYAQYIERGGTDGAGWPGELCCLEGGVDRDDAVAGQGSGSRGITVNAVAPGYIETAMTAVMDEKQHSAIMATIPLGRAGTDVEIAESVAFLSIGGCWIHHRARAGCERGDVHGAKFSCPHGHTLLQEQQTRNLFSKRCGEVTHARFVARRLTSGDGLSKSNLAPKNGTQTAPNQVKTAKHCTGQAASGINHGPSIALTAGESSGWGFWCSLYCCPRGRSKGADPLKRFPCRSLGQKFGTGISEWVG